nr:hypothetical protein CFP56_43936 [Quercus suber]
MSIDKVRFNQKYIHATWDCSECMTFAFMHAPGGAESYSTSLRLVTASCCSPASDFPFVDRQTDKSSCKRRANSVTAYQGFKYFRRRGDAIVDLG